MYRYSWIIIDISHAKLDHPFTYRIPDSLQGRLHAGSRVIVPFGRGNKERTGYVIGFSDHSEYPDEKIKEILDVAESAGDQNYNERALQLAAWMKNRYGSTMATALKTVLVSDRPAKQLRQREIRLLLSPEEAAEKAEFYHKKHQVARERLLSSLMETPSQPYRLVTEKLHVTASVIRALKMQKVLEVITTTSLRNPVSLNGTSRKKLSLSQEQQAIVEGVVRDFENRTPSVSLIHGITGSGKTEVYISIIERICAHGKAAIMLIPEISLTYQTLMRFYRHFGDRVSVMNSTLSPSEKADQWERARRGEIDVIIGPRSALFTPFPEIGVIVIDEEHENSYKNESMPKYQTREVAREVARMHGACLVLGSATPSVDSYYQAQTGQFKLYKLTKRLTGGTLPEVEVVDMRRELRGGNRSILSGKLAALLQDRLDRGEQSVLFLNRRGFSGFVSCRSCGEVIKCPHCDVSLSLHMSGHGGRGRLVCHYCGYEMPMVSRCPECGSPYISGMRAGTEQMEEGLKKRFPQARILRMDADTTAAKGSYEKILSAFANEEADILLGTQMIVKGHDFPGVTLVGVLMADLSLYVNDYRSSERTFQLLTQAAGRAGRGSRPGSVIIQTYHPDHYSIEYAAAQDYEGFYKEETDYRKLLRYPPICHMLAVQILSADEDRGLGLAGDLRQLLQKEVTDLEIIGPAAASIGRIRDCYRYVLYIKNEKYDTLIYCKDLIEEDFRKRNEAGRLRDENVQFDFDPVNPF